MHYEGFHRSRNGYTEYVALAVCNGCGYEISICQLGFRSSKLGPPLFNDN